jgi:hypothetical protein
MVHWPKSVGGNVLALMLAVGVAWGILRRDDVPAAAVQQHAPAG